MCKLGFESEKSAGNVFVFFSLRLTSRTIARSVTQYFSSIICYADISGKYICNGVKGTLDLYAPAYPVYR